MKLLQNLSTLALTLASGSDQVEAIIRFVRTRFSARSESLTGALARAGERAWKAVEVALAGPSLWDRCQGLLLSGDEKKFRRDLETFLKSDAAGPAGLTPALRQQALDDLKRARKINLIPGGQLPPDELTAQAELLSGCTTSRRMLETEQRALTGLIDELGQDGYRALAQVVSLRAPGSVPLLVLAVRFFFGHEVDTDEELRTAFTLQQIEGLGSAQEAGFRGLEQALTEHGQRLETMLGGIQYLVREVRDEVRDQGAQTQALVLALQKELQEERQRASQEQRDQQQQLQNLMQSMIALLQRQHEDSTPREAIPTPQPKLEERREEERTQIRTLLQQATQLPTEQSQGLPAFWFALHTLERTLTDEPGGNKTSISGGVNPIFLADRPAPPAPPVPTPTPTQPSSINPLFTQPQGPESEPVDKASTPPKPRGNPKPRFDEPEEDPANSGQAEQHEESTAAEAPLRGGKAKSPRFRLVQRGNQGPLFPTK